MNLRGNCYRTTLAVLFPMLSLAACDSAQPTGNTDPTVPPPVPEFKGPAPTPVASMDLGAGHHIDFFDIKGRALVTESGPAVAPPLVTGTVEADQLVSLWKKFAPNTSVPHALSDLQARLTSDQKTAPSSSDVPPPRAGGQSSIKVVKTGNDSLGGVAQAATWCGNNCCDGTWLSNVSQCHPDGNFSWFYMDYGWSWVSQGADVVTVYNGFVCSAVGTSSYHVCTGDNCENGGDWAVPQGTYTTFNFVADYNFFTGIDREWVSTSVNSQGNQHDHTYCGRLYY
ncbi:MAG TPA: hypothetical protein VNO55_23675 [Polyangia bacterium]|nr:hypothetical protein [Polyangia bacterium]